MTRLSQKEFSFEQNTCLNHLIQLACSRHMLTSKSLSSHKFKLTLSAPPHDQIILISSDPQSRARSKGEFTQRSKFKNPTALHQRGLESRCWYFTFGKGMRQAKHDLNCNAGCNPTIIPVLLLQWQVCCMCSPSWNYTQPFCSSQTSLIVYIWCSRHTGE